MTRDRLESVMKRMKIGPKFSMKVELGVSNCGTKASAQVTAPDVHDDEDVPHGFPWPAHAVAPEGDDDRSISMAFREAMRRAVCHEVDENLFLDGRPVVDPHPAI
jgi:hypothetical protein